jgi:hypothetical protein
MLQNPEGNSQLISSNNEAHCCQFREQACPVPRWVWQRGPCRLQFHWSTIAPDKNPIRGYDWRLCMFSYYQIHLTSITKTKCSII